MKKKAFIAAVAAVLTLMTASVALAAGPTCAGIDTGDHILANHGDHITGDYVHPGADGPAMGARGAPAHFDHPQGATPGATFCAPGKAGESQPLPQLTGGPPSP